MPRRVVAYVALVVASSLLATAGLASVEPTAPTEYLKAAATFAGLGLLFHAFEFNLGRNASGSSALLPFLTAAFLAPHWSTAAIVAGVVLVREALAHRPVLKGVFNVAQTALALVAAIATYRLLGGDARLETSELHVLPYIALFVVFQVLNTLAVSVAVSLSDRQPVLETWKQHTRTVILYDILSLPFVYAFASVYLQWGFVGAFALALPLIGIRQLYKVNLQLEKINHELLELMVAAIEARDPYTSGHSRRVSRNAKIIARIIGMPSREVERLGSAALLHDVGKIHEVFAPLLRKPGPLTLEERAIMETHPIKSAELVDKVSSLRELVAAVKHHHENWDGSGYPDGLAGEQIPLFARVIMVADTIDAMTTDRPYRAALSEADVRSELARMRGRQFDPAICDALLVSSIFGSLVVSDPGARAGTPASGVARQRIAALG